METVTCDLCGSQEAHLAYRVRDANYGTLGSFSIVRCSRCALIYLNPRPSVAELPAVYPETCYHPFSAVFSADSVAPGLVQWKRAQELTPASGPGRVLDVGCGDGLFLSAMQKLGWACVGVEPNGRAVEFARARLQLDVREGDLFAINDELKFDLITMWDVLEHIPSPTSALRRANMLLAPDGRLALSVPNWDSFERQLFRERWIALDAPRHLYHFSPQTITQLLRKCAFEIERRQAAAPVLSLASNVLRLGGDLVLRHGEPKVSTPSDTPTPSPSATRQALIRAMHLLMTPPNLVANLVQKGATLTIIARKASHP